MPYSDLNPAVSEMLCELEERIAYCFQNSSLLLTALTHSSWGNEHHIAHNERLEFLGDAVLELNISAAIYNLFPLEREGEMTQMRSGLVSEDKLAEIAADLQLGKYLFMGKGEELQGGRQRHALLADAVEALLGAVFLDGGFDAASALIHRLYRRYWPKGVPPSKTKDYKTRLQEVTQATLRTLPVYTYLSSIGPEHARIFNVQLELSNGRSFTAQGGSIKKAEQEAARMALKDFGESEDH